MSELPTQLGQSGWRHTAYRYRAAIIALMIVGGGGIGWLAALGVSELLLGSTTPICQLPAPTRDPRKECLPVAADTAIAPVMDSHLTTAANLMEALVVPAVAEPSSLPPLPTPADVGTPMYPFKPPPFNDSVRLQEIVARLAAIAETSDYPIDALSISLVDLTTGEYAGLHDRTPRYPASVIKPFWAIAAIAHGETGPDIEAAITYSNNAASNRLLNRVGHQAMRTYWQAAGFSVSAQYPVNISAAGRPGNRVTTIDLIRLLHDIASPNGHQRIAQIMWHDIESERQNAAGAVKGFIGEGLPKGALLTKVGLTSSGRGEMAILYLGDHIYAVAIIGAHRTYARSASIFPAFGDTLFQLLSQ